MHDSDPICRVAEEVAYLLAKRVQEHARPQLVVTHGYQRRETYCLDGETVEHACLAVGTTMIPLRLSPTGLVVTDVFVRRRNLFLSAAQIERIIATDPFYVRLGANAGVSRINEIRPSRTSIKVYVRRLRMQLTNVFSSVGIEIAPEKVIISERTDTNVVVYRLGIPSYIMHVGATDRPSPRG